VQTAVSRTGPDLLRPLAGAAKAAPCRRDEWAEQLGAELRRYFDRLPLRPNLPSTARWRDKIGATLAPRMRSSALIIGPRSCSNGTARREGKASPPVPLVVATRSRAS
jgi:hypothetical protein